MAECFIGRQPMFNRDKELHAYELLYSAAPEAAAEAVNDDAATSELIMNAFVEIGLENLVGDNLAYITLSRDFLLNPDLVAVPPEQVVVQTPSTLALEGNLPATLARLRDQGYTVALSNLLGQPHLLPLLPLVDVIKIDVATADDQQLVRYVDMPSRRGFQLVATNVESVDQFDACNALGFDLFQGSFFARPKVVVGKRLPTNKVAVLQLMAKLSDPDIGIDELERLVRMDVSLSHRALHFVNSPLSGLLVEVDSVRQAITLLGRELIKNWAMLLTIANIDDTIPELITTVLVRARLCELLAEAARLPDKDSYFTVGLFSALDAMMDQPMEEVLQGLPFSDEVKGAISDLQGLRGRALACALQLEMGDTDTLAFEQQPWQSITELYRRALRWADESTAAFQH